MADRTGRPGVSQGTVDTKLVGMRRFLSLRWLGLHAAMVVIVAGFLGLGWWQLRRAEGGNALSWGYTFEWPLFAGFVVVFWIKAMRDERRDAQARNGEPAVPAAPVRLPVGLRPGPSSLHSGEPAGVRHGGRGGEPSARQDGAPQDDAGEANEDEELAAYNAYLNRLNAEASRTSGRLAGRASRRQAAGWATRSAGARQAAKQPAPGNVKQPAPGNPPHLEV